MPSIDDRIDSTEQSLNGLTLGQQQKDKALAAPKALLSELPEEILVDIISDLPQKSLVALAQGSKRLKRLSNAELYSTVYWEDLEWDRVGPLGYSARKALEWAACEAALGESEAGKRHIRPRSKIHRQVKSEASTSLAEICERLIAHLLARKRQY